MPGISDTKAPGQPEELSPQFLETPVISGLGCCRQVSVLKTLMQTYLSGLEYPVRDRMLNPLSLSLVIPLNTGPWRGHKGQFRAMTTEPRNFFCRTHPAGMESSKAHV